MKKITLMWSVSLMVISAVMLVTVFSNMLESELPDVLKILLGVTYLVAVFVLVYTWVRPVKSKNLRRKTE